MLDFLDIRILDIVDIFLVSILFYYIYKIIQNSVAMYIFLGISFLYIFWKLVVLFRLDLLSEILGKFMSIGVLILVIVFQKEIRNFLMMIGSSNIKSKNFFFNRMSKNKKQEEYTEHLVNAVYEMAKDKIGALIVIQKNTNLDYLVDTGDKQSILISKPIIESIFYPNSPLHDGAILIDNQYIIGTRLILPISRSTNIPLKYGMRHRAGVGLTEETDCLCIVVSEETGKISLIKNGEINYVTKSELINKII